MMKWRVCGRVETKLPGRLELNKAGEPTEPVEWRRRLDILPVPRNGHTEAEKAVKEQDAHSESYEWRQS